MAVTMAFPIRSAAASTSRSLTWAYRKVIVGSECPSILATVGKGTPLATAWLATVCRRSCTRRSSIPASCLARRQKARTSKSGLVGSLEDGNTYGLPVRGCRATMPRAAPLSQTVRGPVLASLNLRVSPSTSDHCNFRISPFLQPVRRSRRMTSACARRAGRCLTRRPRAL